MDSFRIEIARSATKDLRAIDRQWVLTIYFFHYGNAVTYYSPAKRDCGASTLPWVKCPRKNHLAAPRSGAWHNREDDHRLTVVDYPALRGGTPRALLREAQSFCSIRRDICHNKILVPANNFRLPPKVNSAGSYTSECYS